MIIDESKLICKIVIPEFTDHILLSKARLAKRFKIKRGKLPKLPKKYQSDNYIFNNKGILVEKSTGIPIIANPRAIGTPKYWKINGQDVLSVMHPMTRKIIFHKLKEYLNGFIKDLNKIEDYPIGIFMEMYEFPKLWNWDISNQSFIWYKNFEDELVKSLKLKDDSVEFVRTSGGMRFTPIINKEDRKLVIYIYKEDNYE